MTIVPEEQSPTEPRTETIGPVVLTRISSRKTESRRKNAGEFVALYEATNTETGEKGYALFEYEFQKRDVVFVGLYTDNSRLFVCADWPEGTLANSDGPDCYLDVHADDIGPEPDSNPVCKTCTHEVHVSE